jgi:phenylalanyl-tRNA synthetase beta subunit
MTDEAKAKRDELAAQCTVSPRDKYDIAKILFDAGYELAKKDELFESLRGYHRYLEREMQVLRDERDEAREALAKYGASDV